VPRQKKALQAASVANSGILEPEPPEKLWEELDALCVEYGMIRTMKRTPDTFTAAEYARQSGMHHSSIALRFHRLLAEGRIEYVGRGPNNEKYYRIKK
jgi:hypothetical protein